MWNKIIRGSRRSQFHAWLNCFTCLNLGAAVVCVPQMLLVCIAIEPSYSINWLIRLVLNSLDSHRLKRLSGLDFAKSRQCKAIFHVKYCNSLLVSLVKDPDRLKLLRLPVSHKVLLARSWSGRGRLEPLIRGLMVIAKGFPHPGRPILAEDDAY